MSEAAIWSAWLGALGALGVPVSYPGVIFEPPSAGVWIEARLFGVPADQPWLDDASGRVVRALLQAGVCARPGAGVGQMSSTVDAVLAMFGRGVTIGPSRVVRPPWAGGIVDRGESVLCPVSVPVATA